MDDARVVVESAFARGGPVPPAPKKAGKKAATERQVFMEFETRNLGRKKAPAITLGAVGELICACQKQTGEIPWSLGGKTDPWDHVEAAMGLAVCGRFEEARKALLWITEIQHDDGSCFAAYEGGKPTDRTKDANLSAYLAVGVFHYYLITRDLAFVEKIWPWVKKGVDFAVGLQGPGGEIWWAKSPEGRIDPMALLTGSSSVYMSLKCAVALARLLNRDCASWETAMDRLKNAIRCKPYLFNMTKARYAMDWFYPVLCQAVEGKPAQERLDRLWKKFVVDGQGVKCVSDQPWVTLAETSELILALLAVDNLEPARILFSWICEKTFDDGSFWCGFTVPDLTLWPEEKITWTNAVVLMAADALYGLTPGGRLFHHGFWRSIL